MAAREPPAPEVPQELDSWRDLWQHDRPIAVRSHRSVLGPLIVRFKKLLRPLWRVLLGDLFERQRAFNLALLDRLEDVRRDVAGLDRARGELHRDLLEVRGDLLRDVQHHARRLDHLEGFDREVFGDLMVHTDALFARLDQKFDRYRRESREIAARLGALLVAAREGGPAALTRAGEELDYIGLEERFRGLEATIEERLQPYLSYLRDAGPVLDLGCGRGEALALLRQEGIAARGIDASAEMVRTCRERGLAAEEGDVLAALAAQPEGSLGGIVSFHVVEHLQASSLRQLVRLAWRALRPGGILIVETPNPLSLVVAASGFWRDPTHRRPVHPETLQLLFEQAGFAETERLDLHPFPAGDRLPEIDVAALPGELAEIGHRVNGLRDRLDDLLFGAQDYALVGRKG